MIDLKELILEKDNLYPLLRKLMKDARLIAPVENEFGDTLFSVIDDTEVSRFYRGYDLGSITSGKMLL